MSYVVSKQRINKRRDSAAFGEYDKGSEEEEDNDNRQEPEFLSYFHKFPEFFDYRLVCHIRSFLKII